MSQASSIPISRVLGQGNRERVHQVAAVVLVFGAITTVTIGMLYLTTPIWMLRPFLDPVAA
ncbi:hypothetical protein [Mycobacterium leprae]|uniref:hypothetical protein n=1 Tax=Mycobacterium leprae TaxID=1769 RepID=UPI0002E3C00A|nr:hypothetical protein A8144_10930 [Mycobacterium leprae 3125609]OAX70689.1 hypothetical protein A3216_10390 [Mycobacterium leprae 7935681]